MTEPAPPFANDSPPRAETLRVWGDMLLIWALCPRQACQRARRCRGDARICVPQHVKMLPEGVRQWFAGVGAAQQAGKTFDEAMAWLDATEAGDALRDWHAAVAAARGGEPDLPAQWWRLDDAAPSAE